MEASRRRSQTLYLYMAQAHSFLHSCHRFLGEASSSEFAFCRPYVHQSNVAGNLKGQLAVVNDAMLPVSH